MDRSTPRPLTLSRRTLFGAAAGGGLLLFRSPGAGAQPAQGEELADTQELRVGVSRNLVNGERDPWYCHSSLNVWESLITLDDALRPVPGLAERWAMADDGLSWTLVLRPGVAFSDGVPFNADAVLANWAHMRQVSGRPSSFFGLDFDGVYGAPTDLAKVDDLTVRISLPRPLPMLPNSISNFYSAMFSPASFAPNGDFVGSPAATGPFRLVDWGLDRGAELERNETYWGRPPVLTRISLQIYPDANARLSALRAGEVDALAELGALLASQAVELAEDPGFVVTPAPSSCTTYLAYNGLKPPFDDARMRRAVDLALNRGEMVAQLLFGYGSPSAGIITKYATAIRSDSPEAQLRYDPEQARTLAQEALGGGRAGVTLLFSPPTGRSARPFPQIAAYLQAVLAPLGLDVELRQLESAAASDARAAGEFNLHLSGTCFPNGDPDYLLRRVLSSQSTANAAGDGNGGYANPEADQLLDEARATLDPALRAELYDRLQQIAARDVPTSPLYDESEVVAHRTGVRGLGQRVNYQPTFGTTYLVR
jgi:peptide/nickel transport system substrate-binding protein